MRKRKRRFKERQIKGCEAVQIYDRIIADLGSHEKSVTEYARRAGIIPMDARFERVQAVVDGFKGRFTLVYSLPPGVGYGRREVQES